MMDRAILTFICSFTIGIAVSSFIFVSPLVSLLLVIIACAILVGEKIVNILITKEALLLAILVLAFGLGTLRYALKDFHEVISPSYEGIVVSKMEQKENATRFVFKADNGEKVLVSGGLYVSVEYGDRIKLSGKFERPGVIEGEDGKRNFDYAAYLAKDEIYHTMSFAEIEVVGSGFGNPVRAFLYKVKSSFVGQTRETFAEPYASLLAGLVVSGRDAMPKSILEEFRRAGIIHIVVLSGYNITIIADFLRKFFEKMFLLSRFAAIPVMASVASIAGIILFVLMTGAEATVVRASIMVLAVIMARMMGRNYSAPRALLLAGFIMLMENPKILIFDPSFQLSFLATLALIYVVPIVEKYLKFVTEKMELRTVIATTIGTQLTVLPLLIYSVRDFSLVSLPANILVLLIIPYTMLLGFLATTLSYISSILALPFAYITHLLLAWILEVSNFFGNMSYASIKVPEVSFVIILVIYLMLALLVRRLRSSSRNLPN